MSRLRLKGKTGSLVIASDFWGDILTWAEENGWRPEHDRQWYEATQDEVHVSTSDAVNLAETLEFIAGDIVLHEMDDVSDDFIRQLVDGLMELTVLQDVGCWIGLLKSIISIIRSLVIRKH